MSGEIRIGDCVEVMAKMPAASVDAIVTDPPYGLEFMGRDWDSFKAGRAAEYAAGGELITPEQIDERRGKGGAGPVYTRRPARRCGTCGRQEWSGTPCTCEDPDWQMDHSPLRAFQDWTESWAREALRVLKPGGHLLAFGGTRTYHRMTVGVEDAGFEVRDCLAWLYGSGFPKSLDVSKSIDKAAGATRQIVALERSPFKVDNAEANRVAYGEQAAGVDGYRTNPVTVPATPEAAAWEGWGTALKPAHEPIVLARKPLGGTVASNVLKHGTGALNVDACRIAGAKGDGNWRGTTDRVRGDDLTGYEGGWNDQVAGEQNDAGRWPANVMLDPEAGAMLDEQAPDTGGGGFCGGGIGDGMVYGDPGSGQTRMTGRVDANGGASRFYYCAKASAPERAAGLDGRNVHPTVKPIALMRWLIRLVTPPGGVVLDPFTGSGTTGAAAALEGVRFIGVERDGEYAGIATERIRFWQQFEGEDEDDVLDAEARAKRIRDTGQLDLLGKDE